MKIVILQSMYDSLGGIYYVNKELMKMFYEEKYDIYLISIRISGDYHKVEYPSYVKNFIINPNEKWGIIRLKSILQEIKHLKLFKAFKLLLKRQIYKIKLNKDYKKTKKTLRMINPDIIINSHYELLNSIPSELLKKTIMHFHTTFNVVKENKSYTTIFNKYKDKIYKFVWLTQQTAKEAINYGYKNSVYIYNSVRINSRKIADVNNNNNLVFIGRLSQEKRLDLILKVFDELSKEFENWKLLIYGIGKLTKDEERLINSNKQIEFMGPTNDIKNSFLGASININTSDFEGFSMTILEANEFGVPTICFEFGESVHEQVKTQVTGVVVAKKDIASYKKELRELMSNKQKLKKLSKNCKDFNKNFSYNKIKPEWIKLIEGVNNE